ncbi:MAG: KEOPS complex Pcc1-like subunit [Thermoproteus sp.]|nr:KEOPS complex Pcc1-like subunit [Thermoproteus sp.]
MRVLLRTPLSCEAAEILSPDDVNTPAGMKIRHLCLQGRYALSIEYEGDVMTLKNTIDDVLRCLKVVEGIGRLNIFIPIDPAGRGREATSSGTTGEGNRI